MAKMALEVIGRFSVRDCGVGRAAVRAAFDYYPDLILLDAGRSRGDVLTTLAMLRALPHLAHTPAMLVTEMEGDALFYLDAEAVGVLPKPLAPLKLASQLRLLWARSQRARHIAPDMAARLPVTAAAAAAASGAAGSIHARPGLL